MPDRIVMTLPDGAHRLGVRYHHALDSLLCGLLEGWKENGRWKVCAASVERLAAERERAERKPTG